MYYVEQSVLQATPFAEWLICKTNEQYGTPNLFLLYTGHGAQLLMQIQPLREVTVLDQLLQATPLHIVCMACKTSQIIDPKIHTTELYVVYSLFHRLLSENLHPLSYKP